MRVSKKIVCIICEMPLVFYHGDKQRTVYETGMYTTLY